MAVYQKYTIKHIRNYRLLKNYIYSVAKIKALLLRPFYTLNYLVHKFQNLYKYYPRHGETDYVEKK